ncbi:Preprotein translocase subunit SecY [Vibrio sp.]|nr:Preprotein translocase subunit SecY [Vibrio sp.]
MNDKTNQRIRHPKGRFAMTVVYSFTGASILASIIFSLLLFLSIDNDPWMQVLFGSLAVIFELGKFFAWYEFGERVARRSIAAAASAFTFYSILAAISIGGSIGGINSATNTAQSHMAVHENRRAAYDRQIEAIDKQIELNNVAAQKYIELNRIAVGVTRIQQENAELQQKQLKLAEEREKLPVAEQGSVIGLIASVAQALNMEVKHAQLYLVVFLSVLLDLFAAFFVGLIGEELRFSRTLKAQKELRDRLNDDIEHQHDVANLAPEAPEIDQAQLNRNREQLQAAVLLLETGEVRCSKKAVATAMKLNADEVDTLFDNLMVEGYVTQKPNRHFVWQGKRPSDNTDTFSEPQLIS